jgi:peptidoglycan/xylan/chitin deacetylase (PgdA/CDA1 family)
VTDPYASNLLGGRRVIPQMLRLFEKNGIAATWATVGFLFARSTEELERFKPRVLPCYRDERLNPYKIAVGADERSDPFHYASTLIRQIQQTPRQEIGTHTYSHHYCREDGQNAATFHADLRSAVGIARQHGITLRSIVFPSNQHNEAYDPVLLEHGIRCFRGNWGGWLLPELGSAQQDSPGRRAARLADSYVNISGDNLVAWAGVREPSGLCNVAASAFLRPYMPNLRVLEPMRRRRLVRSMRRAAREGKIFHLWWHPHNFGGYPEPSLAFLTSLIDEYKRLAEEHGMQSLSMADVGDRAPQSGAAPLPLRHRSAAR